MIGSTRILAVLLGVLAALPCAPARAEQTPTHLDPVKDSAKAIEPLVIPKPLIAYWTFDEVAGGDCRDSSGQGCDVSPEGRLGEGLARAPGVFGNAMTFSGQHMLRAAGKPVFGTLAKISLSAWAMPIDLKEYKEIFRKEDGENRVLFSFQDHGKHLSLGLNVGGYVECDAPIEPAQVIDGGWHHCAATFDGKVMRVYLDGKEIGALERPGTATTGGGAPGCVGSSNGGECFQGGLDDLRIYRDALTADEVAALYRNGLAALERLDTDTGLRLEAFYAPAKTFAETLARSRRNLIEKNVTLPRELANAVARKLRAAFADDYSQFVKVVGASPLQYLTAADDAALRKEAERLAGMMAEYKPLTESQWNRLPPPEAAKWKEVEAIEKRLADLKKLGDAARFSPDWITVLLEAGRRIQPRPSTFEAVAPYVPPSTPPTRDLTEAEARAALERDWMHQADGNPSPARIRQEIEWTRRLAARIRAGAHDKFDDAADLARLAGLEKQAAALAGPDSGLYFRVREVKRSILFRNPAVDFGKVLLVDMPYPAGSEWPHETRHRLGYMAVPGGRLLVLDGLSPGGRLTQLMPRSPLHGSFWRPDVSYDARKVLFCFKPHNEKSFHLYAINTDGAGLVQLTDGPYDDFDPIYLPDDRHIVFSTTRGHTYVRCMPPTNAYVLARCDRDGRNIYLVSSNNEPDYLPSVMDDGRIVYTRWEYTDKPLWRAQKLWAVRPDGTQVNTVWGNQSVWPDLMKDARSIPGTRRIMFTGSAHHNWFSGSVGIIDPDTGSFNFPTGLAKVTADVAWPECGNGPVDPVASPNYHASGRYDAYYSPYPLGEHDFMVSANRGGKFVLYLMDLDGNRELIYEGVHNIFHAMPLKPRARPPVLADTVEWPRPTDRLRPREGVLFSSNVYQGAPEELRGRARYLRVLNIEHKTYTYWYKRPYISTGPVVSGVQSDGVKRVLGTVPIEQDGSVSFYAPAGIPLHFQLLDAGGRALQTMRSFVGLMPGERRGCLGCHELHSRTPEGGSISLAVAKEPRAIAPPPWTDDSVSYPRYVRPVLDKYCGKCHQGDGEGRKVVDQTPRPGLLGFDETYWLFTGRPTWGWPYVRPKDAPPGFGIAGTIMVEGYDQRDPAAYKTPRPMSALSYKSRLIEIASSGKHHDVKVDPVSLQRLILWVDTMCPYRGAEEVREEADPEFQGVDWLSIRPKIRNAPTIVRPGPVD